MTKMSRPIIRDGAASSSNSDTESCSDQKMRAWEAGRFVKRIFSSSDKVDKQLLNLFKVRQTMGALKTLSITAKGRP